MTRSRMQQGAVQCAATHAVRQRAQRLLRDCRQASASDADINALVSLLIAEAARVAAGVLSLMPADAAALAQLLGEAYTTLVGLVEEIEHAGATAFTAVGR